MPDDRDHGKDEKQMDQAAGDVKSREPQNPHYEQNDTDKQKHGVPPEAIFIQAFIWCLLVGFERILGRCTATGF